MVKGLCREVRLCHLSGDNGMVDVLVNRLAIRLMRDERFRVGSI